MATRRRAASRRRSPNRRRPATAARRWRRTPLDRLRAICLALPEATEKIAWGEPTWRVRGKLFAQLDDHHHGAEHLAVWLPAPLGEQEAMIFTDPARFFRPPYVGPRGWVGVRIDGKVDWSVVSRLVTPGVRPGRAAAAARSPGRGDAVVRPGAEGLRPAVVPWGRCVAPSDTCPRRSRAGSHACAGSGGSTAPRPRSCSG